jgi:hypothetical protein
VRSSSLTMPSAGSQPSTTARTQTWRYGRRGPRLYSSMSASSSSPASTLPTSQACWRGRRRPGSPVHMDASEEVLAGLVQPSQRARRPQQMPLCTSETTIVPGVGFRAELGDYLFQ